MQARDVMQSRVITVAPETHVRDIAARLLDSRISAVPVVDEAGRLLGIVSEGDLMRRPESGTERHPSWWLRLLGNPDDRPIAYIKSHGAHAAEVMTRDVISVGEDATLEQIADTLERHRIKRVPVLRDGKLVGIVSRADLLHGLVARQASPAPSKDDRMLKAEVEKAIQEAGAGPTFLSVVVAGGTVHLWGAVETAAEKQAARIAAEGVPGVRAVRDEIGVLPPVVRSVMWAE
ncbi:BON domain-containing protein [Tistlia consotensis]|uniref:BON domain-containing protein n=1 Tax=Tistlia consotensis USBA 355 TaxID=560819 RepID=A0A1Y6BTJ5_9PROT|nr:CBS domain-containing protein [Tistlia consotensis]SMF27622.1 BON domain-containing protein [Tistlia consotensis USBA 355]SNR65919.1 BON domain-containing protein [Tistlia consotensis]